MTFFNKKIVLLTSSIIFSQLISGCKSNTNTKKILSSSIVATNSLIIQGNAILGPVSGARVVAYSISKDGSLDLTHPLANTTTDSNGNYSLIVPSKNLSSAPLGIQLTDGSYQEESSGQFISLSRKNLTALLPAPIPGTQINAAIGPLSEMAFQVFKANVKTAGIQSVTLAQHAKNANGLVAKSFGLSDVVGIIPANPNGKIPNNSNGQYTLVLAALSKAADSAGTDSIALGAAYSKHLVENKNLDSVGQVALLVSNAAGNTVSITPPTVQKFSNLVNQIGNGTIPMAGIITDPNLIPPIMNSIPVVNPPKPTSQFCTIANGVGTQVWKGLTYGSCIIETCNTNYINVNNTCVASSQVCAVPNGSGSQIWNGTGWDRCSVNSCNSNYSNIDNTCVPNSQSCTLSNGVGSQIWSGSSWGPCSMNSCSTNFTKINNTCVANSKSCSIANGIGSQVWNGTDFGTCNVSTCNTNYTKINSSCVANSQVCSVTYGAGSQIWNGSSWGTCNVTSCNANYINVNNSCVANAQSCVIANGTGSQTRNGSNLGTCSVSSCNANFSQSGNACVANTQSCSLSNGVGLQSWTGSGWGTCSISSCNTNYSQSGNTCVATPQSCQIANGTGTQKMNGSVMGSCNLVSCNASFHSAGNSCVYNTQGCSLPNAATAMQSWNGSDWGSCNVTSCNNNFVNTNNTCVAQRETVQEVPPVATVDSSVCNIQDLASLNACVAKLSTVQTLNFKADVSCSGVNCCGPSGGALIAINGFSNKTIQGNNHKLIRHGSQTSCQAIQILNSSRVSVIGLTVDEDASVAGCTPTQNCSDTIDVNGSNQISFESFGLYNSKSFGVGVNNVNGLVFNNSTVSNTGIIGFYAGDNSSQIVITNSTFAETRTNAIVFQGVFGTASNGNLIQNNQIIDNHYQGQWLSSNGGRINGGQIYIPNASYVTVSGNTVTGGNCAECYDSRVWGIELGKEPTPGSAGDVSNLTISQNTFSIQNGCAVFLNQGGSLDNSTVVTSNTVNGSQSLTCAQANGVISSNAFPVNNVGQNTLNNSSNPSTGNSNSGVTGYIDSVTINSLGQSIVSGWACFKNSTQSINVDLYVGAPFGAAGSVSVGRFPSNVASEAAIGASCGTSGTAYRYSITLSAAQTSSYANKLIYLYGIAPVGGINSLLPNSGVLKITTTANSSNPVTPPVTPPVTTPSVIGPVIGNVDGLVTTSSGTVVITGWACAQNFAQSISIEMYVGSPYGNSGSVSIGRFTANRSSESAVSTSCKSTGTAYRFEIPVYASQFSSHSGKAIYIYGIAPVGNNNNLLSNSGVLKVPSFETVTVTVYQPPVAPAPVAPAPAAGPVIGYIDGVYLGSSGQSVISGWACAQNSAAPLTIHLYANGGYPAGSIVNAFTTNVGSEPTVAGLCHSTGASYRFQIPITADMINRFHGQAIYIHGISPNGGASPLLVGSGNFRFP